MSVRTWILALLAAVTPAAAQSINIDLGFPGNGPPPTYRAAGLPGFWHSFAPTEWGVFHDLSDLSGNPVSARVRQIGGTEMVEASFHGSGPEGGDAILLGDALITHQIENCLFFENLENGTYEVTTYAWMPTAPETLNHVWIDFHPDEPMIGGGWPGELEQGTVFARHEFVTSNGVINLHSGIPTGDGPEPGAALNGVQLRLMTVSPPLFAASAGLVWLKPVNAIRYDVIQGDVGTLRATDGDFIAAATGCVANDVGGFSLPFPQGPDPGQARWFLVRGVSGLGPATWNSLGDQQVGDRDPGLSLCP